MRAPRNIFLSICFIVPVAAAFGRDGAGQDIKEAGGSAKVAVVKTGSATGKATVKSLKATGRGLQWGAQKLAVGTGSGVEKSGAALKSVGSKRHTKSPPITEAAPDVASPPPGQA